MGFPGPTGIVATTAFVESEITLTVPDSEFATNTSPLPLSYATAWGSEPTGIVATTAFVESEITVTYEPPFAKSPFATNSSPFPLSYGTARASVPTGIGAATAIVAPVITVTERASVTVAHASA